MIISNVIGIEGETPRATMSGKSLGTLPVIYAVEEQQNPLTRKTMLFQGDANSTGGRNDVFQVAEGFGYQFNIL